MDRSVYLHIGLHKTATTFLQNEYFTEIENVNYLSVKNIEMDLVNICLYDQSLVPDKEIFDSLEKKLKNGINIISCENLSGNPTIRNINREIILARLNRLYPDANIIIGLRDQWDMIGSMYKFYIQHGGTKSFRNFIIKDGERKNETSFGLYNRVSLKNFNYYPLLSRLISDYGRSKVHVFSFENFKANPSKELQKLSSFINVELPDINYKKRVNDSVSWKEVDLLRKVNFISRSYYHEGGVLNKRQKKRILGLVRLFVRKSDMREYSSFLEYKKTIDFSYDHLLLKENFNI